MAGGMDLGSGSGKKRALDANLNLVPFIDLMAVTIVFLIMTAVWTQLGRLRVGGAPSGDPVVEARSLPLRVVLSSTKVTAESAGVPLFDAPLVRTSSRLELGALRAFLTGWKAQHDDAVSVHLAVEDELVTGEVVQVVDAALGSGFPDVSFE